MSRKVSPSANRGYGVLRVARVWGTSRATLYRHRQGDVAGRGRRPGPFGPMPDEALVEAIRALLADSPFHGEGYRKIWARLRFAGIRTSKRRVLRLMRVHGLLAPGRVGRPHGPRAHDGTIRTERIDVMWGTDLTSTLTGEGQASIFVTVDHASTECLGIHARPPRDPLRGARAAPPGRARLLRRVRREASRSGLKLRHDHGSQFVADDFQRELAFLGIASSPAFVREPEGNGCVERFIRTLKENLLWVRRFDTIEELRQALHAFKDDLQPRLDRRAPRLPDTRRRQSSAARAAPGRGMNLQRGVSLLLTATLAASPSTPKAGARNGPRGEAGATKPPMLGYLNGRRASGVGHGERGRYPQASGHPRRRRGWLLAPHGDRRGRHARHAKRPSPGDR